MKYIMLNQNTRTLRIKILGNNKESKSVKSKQLRNKKHCAIFWKVKRLIPDLVFCETVSVNSHWKNSRTNWIKFQKELSDFSTCNMKYYVDTHWWKI